VTAAPLGAHYDGSGATFALFSSVADAVELCLFDDTGNESYWQYVATGLVLITALGVEGLRRRFWLVPA
jgi:pullulanase/glycogen debranching enzyme